jgi:hypothetical protein
MHTKLAAREAPLPSSHNSHTPPEPPNTVSPTNPVAPEVEISEEVCPPNSSEPSSPASEDDYSSGGEQISFQEDHKSFMHPQFSGNNQYYVMSLPNGMGGAGTDGMMSTALPNTAWGGTNDAGMPEGSYVHVMDSGPYLPHTQPMDGQMTSDPMSPPPEGEGLRATLIRQLEYYFSKENLSSDKYLCEHNCIHARSMELGRE